MNRFAGYAIYSDIDNTLLAPDGTIAARNLEALERFTREGGLFALASGRGPTKQVFDLFARLPMINAPCILLNGALLYEIRTRTALRFRPLPPQLHDWLCDLHRAWPDWPISVCTAEERYQIGPDVEDRVACAAVETLTMPWGKLLFHVPAPRRLEAMEWLSAQGLSGIDVTACDEALVEIVPHGVSKGSALEEIIAEYGLARRKVAAAGDYDNDLAMLQTPGIRAFCPANAAEKIKAVCERTLCDVRGGVLADIVELFETEAKR